MSLPKALRNIFTIALLASSGIAVATNNDTSTVVSVGVQRVAEIDLSTLEVTVVPGIRHHIELSVVTNEKNHNVLAVLDTSLPEGVFLKIVADVAETCGNGSGEQSLGTQPLQLISSVKPGAHEQNKLSILLVTDKAVLDDFSRTITIILAPDAKVSLRVSYKRSTASVESSDVVNDKDSQKVSSE